MAPIEPSTTAEAESAIRDTIQSLYNVMLHTSAYDAAGPQTTVDALVAEVHVLSEALQSVAVAASTSTSTSASTATPPLPSVPRDLVQYVEAGRNPDIYTREFVELVRRTNQLRAGKSAAFAQFRDVLAGQIRAALPELAPDVDTVLRQVDGSTPAACIPAPGAGAGTAISGSGNANANGSMTADTSGASTSSSSPAVGTAMGTGISVGMGTATPSSDATLSATQMTATASTATAATTTTTAATATTATTTATTSVPTTIDMMGLLPGTPQPGTAASTTTPGATSGTGDAMQT